jgi:hypothetical protein
MRTFGLALGDRRISHVFFLRLSTLLPMSPDKAAADRRGARDGSAGRLTLATASLTSQCIAGVAQW